MSARRTWTYFFSLWLSLGIVLTHAALPVGAAPGGRGSAFSASTADVSLGPSRRDMEGRSAAIQRAADDTSASNQGGSADPQPAHLAATVALPIPAAARLSRPAGPDAAPAQTAPGDYHARAPPTA